MNAVRKPKIDHRPAPVRVARVYLRVSTDAQDLERQESIVTQAKASGYHIAGVYREKASGARPDRPELMRMIEDLQPGEIIVAERMDRISRLPLKDAERLVEAIQSKGAWLSVPGVVDLSELIAASDGVTQIVLEAVQTLLLRLALQSARDDYEQLRKRQNEGIARAKREGRYRGRPVDKVQHKRIVTLRKGQATIAETARLAGCSETQVKRVWKDYREKSGGEAAPPRGAPAKGPVRIKRTTPL